MSPQSLFIFVDESGNFDFSPRGTRYFVLTALSTTNPDEMAPPLYRLKHELALAGQGIEYFHATEDRQAVDCCNWAVYVRWERGELRPYEMIRGKLRSEFEIVREGATRFCQAGKQ